MVSGPASAGGSAVLASGVASADEGASGCWANAGVPGQTTVAAQNMKISHRGLTFASWPDLVMLKRFSRRLLSILKATWINLNIPRIVNYG